jgi:hypothetical protein
MKQPSFDKIKALQRQLAEAELEVCNEWLTLNNLSIGDTVSITKDSPYQVDVGILMSVKYNSIEVLPIVHKRKKDGTAHTSATLLAYNCTIEKYIDKGESL